MRGKRINAVNHGESNGEEKQAAAPKLGCKVSGLGRYASGPAPTH